MVDPKSVVIQGDLSRRDAEVLLELCRDKFVVEFGVGGSTLLIARVAQRLQSYDTSVEWLSRTAARIKKIEGELSCIPEFSIVDDVADDIPECEVLFIDGKGEDRYKWLKFFPKCNIMICHDSLGDTGGNGPALYHIMAELFKNRECVEYLDRADFHYKDSNMVVIYSRPEPIRYHNWNLTETDNRLDPYAPI